MPPQLLPASAAAFEPRASSVHLVLGPKVKPWLTHILKRVAHVKRLGKSVQQHQRCLTETLSSQGHIDTHLDHDTKLTRMRTFDFLINPHFYWLGLPRLLASRSSSPWSPKHSSTCDTTLIFHRRIQNSSIFIPMMMPWLEKVCISRAMRVLV